MVLHCRQGLFQKMQSLVGDITNAIGSPFSLGQGSLVERVVRRSKSRFLRHEEYTGARHVKGFSATLSCQRAGKSAIGPGARLGRCGAHGWLRHHDRDAPCYNLVKDLLARDHRLFVGKLVVYRPNET